MCPVRAVQVVHVHRWTARSILGAASLAGVVASAAVACDSPRVRSIPREDVSSHDAGREDATVGRDSIRTPELGAPLVLGVGQSLCAGVAGQPVLSTEQPYGNLTLWDPGPDPKFSLDGGLRSEGGSTSLVLVPLVEPIRGELSVDAGYPRFAYPNHVKGETFHTAMANGITARGRALGLGELLTVHSNVCEGARSLADLRRGGKSLAYAAGLFETRAYAELTRNAAKRPWVSAVVLTHGEADAENPNYEAELSSYFDELSADLRAITGQTRPLTFFVSQQNAAPARGRERASRSTSSFETWHLSTVRTDVVCVGPKYDFPYAKDRIHSTASGYRRLGEKLAEAYVDTVVRGAKFRPLEPVEATFDGAVARVTFHIPHPPLDWETTLGRPHDTPSHPWSEGRGFEVADASGDVGIVRARLEAEDVVLELARAVQAPALVRYAMTQDREGPKGFRGGEPDGRTGLLVDSDPFEGEDTQSLDVVAVRGGSVLTGSFSRRGRRDRIEGEGIPRGTILLATNTTTATMSAPYMGTSGLRHVKVHADTRNHAVMFEMALRPAVKP